MFAHISVLFKRLLMTATILVMHFIAGQAQTVYPGYVTTILVPPYSLYLDDYATGMREPVMVGVDYKSGHPGNYDKITDHWVVITARRQDTNGVYYTYMEVGQRDNKVSGFDLGTSTDRNRFYFDETGNYLVAIEATVGPKQFIPVVTVIRGKSNDGCCKRSSYVIDKKADNANRIDKKNADGTFIVIRQNKSDYKIN
jgi:hypothetical protein